jgi:secreted trypsin-like serine protease
MRKLLTLAAGLVAGMALLVTPAGAITGNFQEDFVHDYVGLIVFYDADGEFMWRCSGSLIAPTVFLTAGHCTDQGLQAPEVSPTSARIYFRQDAGASFDPVTEVDPKSGYPETCVNDPAVPDGEEICVTASKLYDYGFDNFAGFPNHRDVGIAILDTPVTTLGFAALPSPNQLTNIAKKKNDIWLTSSGYGVTKWTPRLVSFRERLMADSYIVNLHNSLTDGFNIQSTANPGGGKGGTCNGDSGGPVFLQGTNTIVGVTSFGLNHRCKGLDFSYRIDRPEVLAWIASHSS